MASLTGCPNPVAVADAATDCITLDEWNIRGGIINSLAELIAPLWDGAIATADCTPIYVASNGDITTDPAAGCQFLGVHVGSGHVLSANPTACLLVDGGVNPCTWLAGTSAGAVTPTVAGDPNAVGIALASGAGGECVLSMLLPQSAKEIPAHSCPSGKCRCYLACDASGNLSWVSPKAAHLTTSGAVQLTGTLPYTGVTVVSNDGFDVDSATGEVCFDCDCEILVVHSAFVSGGTGTVRLDIYNGATILDGTHTYIPTTLGTGISSSRLISVSAGDCLTFGTTYTGAGGAGQQTLQVLGAEVQISEQC